VRAFSSIGFTILQSAAIRLTIAAVVMFLFLLLFKWDLIKIHTSDLPLLTSIGLFSIAAMTVLYFKTIELTNMSVAAILLYLSPIVVMILSSIIFKEKLTVYKTIPLVLAVFGCILVSGFSGTQNIGVMGCATGIGSAIAYGLYSILGNIALKKYHPFTITLWAFGAAAIVLLLLCNPVQMIDVMTTVPNPLYLFALVIGIGILTAVIPFVLYTVGLKGTEPSRAAVLACFEPVAATVFGIIFYHEMPNYISYCGMALVFTAIVLFSGIFQKKRD
ncbi:MAG: EamA family transporter, partial [Clostridia bacterium]|nr:EamA family transporter [Clostridia bacterium]